MSDAEKVILFDYWCWLDGFTMPEELSGVPALILASDGTTCWGTTPAVALAAAYEHDKEIYLATKSINDPG